MPGRERVYLGLSRSARLSFVDLHPLGSIERVELLQQLCWLFGQGLDT
jgi:hypothetical protein